jgi:hypothetical protein
MWSASKPGSASVRGTRHLLISFGASVRTILLLLSTPLVSAQTPDVATVRGIVSDQSGAAIVSASIRMMNETTGALRTATSNALGKFTLLGVTAQDPYTIVAEKNGFAPARQQGMRFMAGSRADISLVLRIPGEISNVSVRGDAGDLRIDQPQLGIEIGRDKIAQTPLPFARITYFPLLNAANKPAISQGDVFINQNLLNTNGAGRRQTWFEVDGSNAVGPSNHIQLDSDSCTR